MNRRSSFEIAVGLVVTLLCVVVITHIIRFKSFTKISKYSKILNACFYNIEGITLGSDVKIGGTVVGIVEDITLNQETFQVCSRIAIDSDLQIPTDSALSVVSSGLFNSRYFAIKIGNETKSMQRGDYFSSTQSSLNLEDLVSKFATSFSQKKG